MKDLYAVAVIFFAVERGLSTLFPPGTRRCPKAMRKMHMAFTEAGAKDAQPEANDLGRTMLRTRCAVCPAKCKGRLA